MRAKLTAAVVGGGFGGKLSLAGLANSDRYELLAAADLRAEVRLELESRYPGLKTYNSHQEMFEHSPADVVCVSTYPPSHEAVVMDALRRMNVRGLLVEKPLGDTAAAGRRILQAIRARALPTVVPHGLRVRASPREIVRRIANGEIGEVKLIEVQCDKWDLLNAGIHWLDFCLAATQETPIRSVMCACDTSTCTYRDGMQVETEAITFVTNEAGTRFILQTGDYIEINAEGDGTLFRIYGTAGQLEFRAWQPPYRLMNSSWPDGRIFTPDEFPESAHQLHLERLAEQIESGTPDYSWPQSSLAALEVCEAAFTAWQHRCKVTFPLEHFSPPLETAWNWGKPYSGAGGGRDGRKLE